MKKKARIAQYTTELYRISNQNNNLSGLISEPLTINTTIPEHANESFNITFENAEKFNQLHQKFQEDSLSSFQNTLISELIRPEKISSLFSAIELNDKMYINNTLVSDNTLIQETQENSGNTLIHAILSMRDNILALADPVNLSKINLLNVIKESIKPNNLGFIKDACTARNNIGNTPLITAILAGRSINIVEEFIQYFRIILKEMHYSEKKLMMYLQCL